MRLATLGSYSTKILTKSIRSLNDELKIYEANYSQIDLEIINDDYYLNKFLPDFVFIHETSISSKRKYYGISNFRNE